MSQSVSKSVSNNDHDNGFDPFNSNPADHYLQRNHYCDSLFHSTIASSDSDYTADKAEVNTQCVAVSPLAEERVVS